MCVFYTNVNDTLPFVHGDSHTYYKYKISASLAGIKLLLFNHCYCYGCGHYLQLDALFLGNLFAHTSSICNTYCVRLICASKRRKTLLVTVAVVVVVVVFVVVFVDSRKLTICSVMELRRFRILLNLYNRHFGISRLFKFQFNSISRRLRILLLLLLPFCFLLFFFFRFVPSSFTLFLRKDIGSFRFFSHAHSDKMARAEDFQIIVR